MLDKKYNNGLLKRYGKDDIRRMLTIELKHNLIDLFIVKYNRQFESIFGCLVTTLHFGPQNKYSRLLVDRHIFFRIIDLLQKNNEFDDLEKIYNKFQIFTQHKFFLKDFNKFSHTNLPIILDTSLDDFLETINSQISEQNLPQDITIDNILKVFDNYKYCIFFD